jgi:hypothetical protein
MDTVRVEPTEAFATAQLAAPASRRPRDLGERASLEIILNYPLAQNERALLSSDNRDIGRVIVIDPDRLILLTASGGYCTDSAPVLTLGPSEAEGCGALSIVAIWPAAPRRVRAVAGRITRLDQTQPASGSLSQ